SPAGLLDSREVLIVPRAIVLSALNVEHRAVRAHLHDLVTDSHDRGSQYEVGRFEENGQAVWDILIQEVGDKNDTAAFETERAIGHFGPDVAMFVGVAGGLKDVGLGDVVAATRIYGFESGKSREEFEP